MIVSFQHRFVFVAIPKTATQAFRVALRPHLGARDWEQCVLIEEKRLPVPALAEIGHGHLTCQQIRPYLVSGWFENAWRFCTVRNPFDRFVSTCYFGHRDNQRMQDTPLETMKRMIGDAKTRRHALLRPQSEFVTDEDGRLLVDQVCRFEALQTDFDRLCERLRLPASRLPRVNVTNQGPHSCRIDRELEEAVADVYRRDFELFEYNRNLPANLQPDSDEPDPDVC